MCPSAANPRLSQGNFYGEMLRQQGVDVGGVQISPGVDTSQTLIVNVISQDRRFIQYLMRRTQAGGTQCGPTGLSGLHGTFYRIFEQGAGRRPKKSRRLTAAGRFVANNFLVLRSDSSRRLVPIRTGSHLTRL